jgi:hypothetical protein
LQRTERNRKIKFGEKIESKNGKDHEESRSKSRGRTRNKNCKKTPAGTCNKNMPKTSRTGKGKNCKIAGTRKTKIVKRACENYKNSYNG